MSCTSSAKDLPRWSDQAAGMLTLRRTSQTAVARAIEPKHSPAFSREQLLHLFTSAPRAFWRHDIDLSLDAAVKMARFAQIAGVHSTFFLNPRCDFYNVFSREGAAAIEAIQQADHILGLHCDCPADADPVAAALSDFRLLDVGYLGVFSNRVSFHMPSENVLWKDFDWFENAYASRWEGRYLSDSRGVALNGNVRNGWQINLHPEHWAL